MSALYLETSAVLSVLFQESGHALFLERMGASPRWITSRLTQVEMERAILRRALSDPAFERRGPGLHRELRGFYSRVDWIEMSRGICELAGRVSPQSPLRSLDAIHLATYRLLRSRSPSIEMLSADSRLIAQLDS